MTNVKVYVSLQKDGARERMERGGGGEEEEEKRGEGEREEMPCIPLSGQQKPQREGRGGNDRNERNTGNGGGGEVKGGGWKVGIRPPYIRTDRDRKGGGVYKQRNEVLHSSLPQLWS